MLVAIALSLALQGHPSTAIVRVSDIAYFSADLASRAAELSKSTRARVSPESVVDSLVYEAVLACGALESGAVASPEAKAAVEAERTQVLANAFVQRELRAKAIPTEEQVKKLFHMSNDKIRLHLVVLQTRVDAQAARERLSTGGDVALEASRSLHRSAANRGDTGLVDRLSLDGALGEAAFGTPVGALFGPVGLGEGWATGRVVEKTIADETRLPSERPIVEAVARREIASFQRRHFLAKARSARKVTVDEAWLESLGTRVATTAEEATHPIAFIDTAPILYRDIMKTVASMAGGGSGGHGFGPSIRKQIAQNYVDSVLLASGAREAGLDKDPEVRAAIARSDASSLAHLELARIFSTLPSRPSDADRADSVEKRVSALKKTLTIQIDMAAARAALGNVP